MKFKILSEAETTVSATNISKATAFAITIDSNGTTVTIDNVEGTDTRTIVLSAGIHRIKKNVDEVVTCSGCSVTKIAITE